MLVLSLSRLFEMSKSATLTVICWSLSTKSTLLGLRSLKEERKSRDERKKRERYHRKKEKIPAEAD